MLPIMPLESSAGAAQFVMTIFVVFTVVLNFVLGLRS
jgi:hypothetical protein